MAFAQLRSRPIYNTLNYPLSVTPTVTTGAVTVYDYVADGLGDVTSDGGGTITERGLVWSLSSDPTISDFKVTSAGTTGSFGASMTDLLPYTTYHVRAYAINSVGTSYGDDVSFTTTTHPRYGFISYNAGVF